MFLELYNADCLTALKQLKDDSVDMVITSPPYNMNLRVRNNQYCSRQIVKEFSTKYTGFADNLMPDAYFQFHQQVLSELLRVCKGYIFYVIQPITGNKTSLFKLMGQFSQQLKEVIVWDKINSQPAMAQHVLNSTFEFVLVFAKYDAITRQFKNANFNRGTLSNIWHLKKERSTNKTHKATFPKALVETILTNFAHAGDVICDPFMGTGTTGIVALEQQCSFIGMELVNTYYIECVSALAQKYHIIKVKYQ